MAVSRQDYTGGRAVTAAIISLAHASRGCWLRRGDPVCVEGYPEPMELLGVVIPATGLPIAKLARDGDRGATFARIDRVMLWDERR